VPMAVALPFGKHRLNDKASPVDISVPKN